MANANQWDIYSRFYNPLIRSLNGQRQELFRHLSMPSEPRIYIAGCGTGADLRFLPTDSHIVATDYSAGMLNKARLQAKVLHLADVQFRQGRAEYSGLEDNSQDVVLLHLIAAVTDQPQALLDEAVRILKPDGRISLWDKFLQDDKTASLWRKGINAFTRRVATSINLQVAPLLADLPLCIEYRRFYAAGLMQHLILTKR